MMSVLLSFATTLGSLQGIPSLPTGTIYNLIPLTVTSYLGHRPLCSIVLLISLLRPMPIMFDPISIDRVT